MGCCWHAEECRRSCHSQGMTRRTVSTHVCPLGRAAALVKTDRAARPIMHWFAVGSYGNQTVAQAVECQLPNPQSFLAGPRVSQLVVQQGGCACLQAERLRDRVLADTEWLEAGENAPYSAVEVWGCGRMHQPGKQRPNCRCRAASDLTSQTADSSLKSAACQAVLCMCGC